MSRVPRDYIFKVRSINGGGTAQRPRRSDCYGFTTVVKRDRRSGIGDSGPQASVPALVLGATIQPMQCSLRMPPRRPSRRQSVACARLRCEGYAGCPSRRLRSSCSPCVCVSGRHFTMGPERPPPPPPSRVGMEPPLEPSSTSSAAPPQPHPNRHRTATGVRWRRTLLGGLLLFATTVSSVNIQTLGLFCG